MKAWTVGYKGHTIRVEKSTLGEARLLVDGELQDAGFFRFYRLEGVLRNGDGAGEPIRASLGGQFSIRCRIFVDHRLVE